jgi:predicted small secreted protein
MAKEYRTSFGMAVAHNLAATHTTQADVARATQRSLSYVNQTITGAKNVSPSWVDLVADVLRLPSSERTRLHRAAALDQGFKLDLTA